jgi:cyclin-dependent kinase-like
MSRPDTLQKKYVGVLSKRALNFCRSLVQMEPSDRMSCAMCMEHNYFEGLPGYKKASHNNKAMAKGGGLPPREEMQVSRNKTRWCPQAQRVRQTL